jgi:hypothetical protein
VSAIFISYRRSDTSGYGGRLQDELADRFGEAQVFRDVDTIRPGVDFAQVIDQAVVGCDVLLALIGRDWLAVAGPTGGRRLDDPDDFVRLELASALERGVVVIPVLVEEARMPKPTDLPAPLVGLTRFQAIELSDERWHYDVGRLVTRLEEVLGPETPPVTPEPAPRPQSVEGGPRRPMARLAKPLISLAVVVVLAIVVGQLTGNGSSPDAGVNANAGVGGPVGRGTTGAGVDAVLATVPVDKTVWYLGFKVTLDSATVRRVDGAAVLDIPVRLENQRRSNVYAGDVISSGAIIVTSNGRATELSSDSDLPLVPGRATGKGTMRFGVGDDFSLTDAVVMLGSADKNQATVPLVQSGNLVALEPVPIALGDKSLSAGVFSIEVAGAELRADVLERNPALDVEVAKGHRSLVLHLATASTTETFGRNFTPGNLVVGLPDGSTVATEYLNEVIYPNQPARDVDVWFVVNDPPAGAYQLILKGGPDEDATASIAFSVP